MAVFFIIHFGVASLAVLYYLYKNGPRQNLAALTLILLFLPVGGILLFLLLQKSNPATATLLLEDESKARRLALLLPPDVEAEVDVAPIAETLLIADFAQRRKTVLDLLKQDNLAHVAYINMALKNEDTETAHYAASSILHNKRKLDTRLSELSAMHQQRPGDITLAEEYAATLQQFIDSIDLDPADRAFYVQENIKVLEAIYRLNDQISLDLICQLLDLLLEAGSFTRAKDLCLVLQKKYPDSETKYLTLLKSHFHMKDKPAFQAALTEFRNSSLFFGSETISVIRLWLSSMDSGQPSLSPKEVL